jgi:phage-related protein
MATFPILKTGAVAQYPLVSCARYSTQSVRFMDGSRQRFRLIGTGLRQWSIQLDQLDEQELGAVIAFVEQQGGASFAFTDPLTGDNVSGCIISGDKFDAGMKREIDGHASLVIEEIP